MGLSDLKNFSKSGGADKAAIAESRRLVRAGRELLAEAPQWRGAGDGAALGARLDDLEFALKNLDGRLLLGLLGGTGVGKSTLISALAGRMISQASDIRPTTTLPLIYRHADFPTPEGFSGREVIHEIEALRNVAIIDFPDFDSLETAHHQVVTSALRDLDLALWVTDYHKYADRRLYEVMEGANLGGLAQAALLNKRDEILARPDGAEALEFLVKSFAEHLREFGKWQGPFPWPVSASEALAAPEDAAAGGLLPLRHMLDDLAEAKYRRAVEAGNVHSRNQNFLLAVNAAAQPQKWLDQLETLGKLKADYQPHIPLEADMAVLRLHNFLHINPRLETLKGQAQGLLAFLTDLWDFAARPFKKTLEASAAGPPPALAPAFARHLAGWSEEAQAITGGGTNIISDDEALKTGGEILGRALTEKLRDPSVSSALLWLWPLVWAFLLFWAESGGLFTPSALTAAAVRAAAPWLIFSALGDLALCRFIWFRARRAYERAFEKALQEASQELLRHAEERVTKPVDAAEKRLTHILNLTADLNSGTHSV